MWKSLTDIKEHPIHKGYFISKDGKVYTNLRKVTPRGVYPCRVFYEPDYTSEPRQLSIQFNKGYCQVAIRSERLLVHRLVAETFIPNPHNLPEVNHINKVKSDNRVENLEWCDRYHQMEHASASTVRVECIRTGVVFDVYNLTKWCRENNLDQGAMCRTRTGERNQHKGYKLLSE